MAEMTIAPGDAATADLVALVPAVELVNGTGWLPDWPDHRDYTADHPALRPQLESLGIADLAAPAALPGGVDLRAWFWPIENPGAPASSTATPATAMPGCFGRPPR